MIEKGYFSNMEFHEKPINYKQSLLVSINKNEVFKALTKEIPDWWSTIEGASNEVNAEFKVSFGSESYWKFKVESLNEPNEVVWECIESHQDHNLKGIDEEWTNTKLYWLISKSGDKTKIDFVHDGLLSTGVCYEVCSNGWDFYILDSLKHFLEGGVGKPSGK